MSGPLPNAATTTVFLASGGKMTLPLCSRCKKLDISAGDEVKLRREKVQLGRCRCTKREKGER